MKLNWQIDYNEATLVPPKDLKFLSLTREDVAKLFHMFFWGHLSEQKGPRIEYHGVPIHKNPGDLFNYQQIIYEQKPDFIVECGAFHGGSTLYFAHLLDIIGKGRVISVDICERGEVWHEKVQRHERVTCLTGSSTDSAVVKRVYEMVGEARNNFVILDSLHIKEHVYNEMLSYSDLLGPGNYLIVEDSNLNGHPLPPEWHEQTAKEGGPFEAIVEFIRCRNDFRIDTDMEQRFLFSFAACGYLVKK